MSRAEALEVKNSAKFEENNKAAFLKPRYSVVVEDIFLFPVFLWRKLIIENI